MQPHKVGQIGRSRNKKQPSKESNYANNQDNSSGAVCKTKIKPI